MYTMLGAADARAIEPVTDAGNTMAVMTVPATVAPPAGSAAVVPAVPKVAAKLAMAVVLPAAVTRRANAPGANVVYAEYFCSATTASVGEPAIGVVTVASE